MKDGEVGKRRGGGMIKTCIKYAPMCGQSFRAGDILRDEKNHKRLHHAASH